MSAVPPLLDAAATGDRRAAAELLPLVYDELRKLAAARMAQERAGQTLQPTALVHEAYMRLVNDGASRDWSGRGHFFAAAAEAMRRVLIETARRKLALKRGGDLIRQEWDAALLAAPEPREDLLALSEALDKLAAIEPVKAELVKLRYFAGLTADQAAQALGVSSTTAERYWAYARAWLHQEMTRGDDE